MEASRASAAAATAGDSDLEWAEDDEESSSGVSSDHSLHNTNRQRRCRRLKDGLVSELEDWQHFLGAPDDPSCRLLLRYPRGEKEELTLPSTSCLKVK